MVIGNYSNNVVELSKYCNICIYTANIQFIMGAVAVEEFFIVVCRPMYAATSIPHANSHC